MGLLGFPVGLLGYVLFPFSIISLFNEFAAPRGVLIGLLVISFTTCVPSIAQLCGRVWTWLDPDVESFKHAVLVGGQMLTSPINQPGYSLPTGSFACRSCGMAFSCSCS